MSPPSGTTETRSPASASLGPRRASLAAHQVHHGDRDAQRPAARPLTSGAAHGHPVPHPCHLLGHGQASTRDVEAAHPQAGALTPPQPDQGPEPHQGLVLGTGLTGEGDQVLLPGGSPVPRGGGGEPDPSARRPHEPIGLHGGGQQGPQHAVLTAHRPRRRLLRPGSHQALHVPLGDGRPGRSPRAGSTWLPSTDSSRASEEGRFPGFDASHSPAHPEGDRGPARIDPSAPAGSASS